jgi:hypothetical protein
LRWGKKASAVANAFFFFLLTTSRLVGFNGVLICCCPANGSYLTIERRLFPVLGGCSRGGIRLAKFTYNLTKSF